MIKHISGWFLGLTLAWAGITVWDIVRGEDGVTIGIDVIVLVIDVAWLLYAAARDARLHREKAEFVQSSHKAPDEEGPRTIIVPPAPPVVKRGWTVPELADPTGKDGEDGHA